MNDILAISNLSKDKIQLLVKVARMYYEKNMIQSEIAKTLDVSRPYISRLLDEAKSWGIISTMIHDPLGEEYVFANKIKEHFHLKEVMVVPSSQSQNPTWAVAEAAADYINGIIKNGDTFAFSWGETAYYCAQSFPQRDDLKNFSVVQISGSVGFVRSNIYISEIARIFAKRTNGKGLNVPFPTIVDYQETRDAIMKEHSMRECMKLAESADIALIVPGAFIPQNMLFDTNYLSQKEFFELERKDAVGDIASHIVNSKGEICSVEIDRRTLALSLDKIKKIPLKVGVAAGAVKAKVISGLLNGNLIDSLIVDYSLASELLKMTPEILG